MFKRRKRKPNLPRDRELSWGEIDARAKALAVYGDEFAS